jgi:hypothetical protein
MRKVKNLEKIAPFNSIWQARQEKHEKIIYTPVDSRNFYTQNYILYKQLI